MLSLKCLYFNPYLQVQGWGGFSGVNHFPTLGAAKSPSRIPRSKRSLLSLLRCDKQALVSHPNMKQENMWKTCSLVRLPLRLNQATIMQLKQCSRNGSSTKKMDAARKKANRSTPFLGESLEPFTYFQRPHPWIVGPQVQKRVGLTLVRHPIDRFWSVTREVKINEKNLG